MRAPIGEGRLKKRRGTNDVGANEFAWTINRAVNMRFCREMKDCIGLESGEGFVHRLLVANVGLKEFVAAFHFFEGFAYARVSEFIDDKDRGRFIAHEVANKGGTNKTATARHDTTLITHRRKGLSSLVLAALFLGLRVRRCPF